MTKTDWESPLWVVTTYYNPQSFQTRKQNFDTFRRFLQAPLLTVELSKSGDFQLTDQDSDMLLQLTGEDALWQKERLLNVGIDHLPDHVKYVAWIDCDVIFENPAWVSECIALFESGHKIVQLFETALHMPQGWQPTCASVFQAPLSDQSILRETSFVSRFKKEAYSLERFRPRRMRKHANDGISHGIAWAGNIDVLKAVKLFDYNIIGGGDLLFVDAVAAVSSERLQQSAQRITSAHWQCFQHWMEEMQNHVQPSELSYLPQQLLHLWHGDFVNRDYEERLKILVAHDYKPDRDIQLMTNGTWAWSDPNGALAAAIAAYFAGRKEDGHVR